MGAPFLIAETPNAGTHGHRFLVSAGATRSEELLSAYVRRARASDETLGDGYVAVRRKVAQRSTGRAGADEVLVLVGVDAGGLDPETRGALLERLRSLLPLIEEAAAGVDWAAETRLVVRSEVLTSWFRDRLAPLVAGDAPLPRLPAVPERHAFFRQELMMPRRIMTALALVASHAVVAAAASCVTLVWLRNLPEGPPPVTERATAPTPAADEPYDKYIQDMKGLNANEDDIRSGLLEALQDVAALPPEDRDALADKDLARLTLPEIRSLPAVRSFLKEYAGGGESAPLYFVREKYRPAILKLYEGANRTPGRTLSIRKQLWEVVRGFLALREPPPKTLPPRVERLALLRLVGSARDSTYDDVRSWPEPHLPLFTDREAAALLGIEQWLGTAAGQKALPAERYKGLYRDGKINLVLRRTC